MKATKYNKRAGKRTPVVRVRHTARGLIYFKKCYGITHMLEKPYIFWVAIPDIKWPSLREWAVKVSRK